MSNFNDEVCEYNSTPVNENFCRYYGTTGYTKAHCIYPQVGSTYYRDYCNYEKGRLYSLNNGDINCVDELYKGMADVVHNSQVEGAGKGDYIWSNLEISEALHKGKDKVHYPAKYVA